MTLEESRLFLSQSYVAYGKHRQNILESSETDSMNLPPYVYTVDHVARIRSELSITVLEKKSFTKGS